MLNSKIFCIGANKTGTTTIEAVFKGLNFRVPNQQDQELSIVDPLREGNFLLLKNYCDHYDAFQDAPFSHEHNYIIFDVLFPNSKFILTIRDEQEWFESVLRFHKKVFKFRFKRQATESFFKEKNLYLKHNYIYESQRRIVMRFESEQLFFDWKGLYNRKKRINSYRLRNEAIVRYFLDRPKQLLIIDVTKEIDTSKIVDFLSLPKEDISLMPHKNKS